MGPFYGPADPKVYLDLGFFDTLRSRLGAPGDFAQAYVISHEVGHHVQNLLGVTAKVDAMRGRMPEAQIGDDLLQRKMRGTVVPESLTHGSSRRRQTWFKRGRCNQAARCSSCWVPGRSGSACLSRSRSDDHGPAGVRRWPASCRCTNHTTSSGRMTHCSSGARPMPRPGTTGIAGA